MKMDSVERLIIVVFIFGVLCWLTTLTFMLFAVIKEQKEIMSYANEVSDNLCFVNVERYGD